MSTPRKRDLELGPPLAACGYCRFTSALAGNWSVEDGRLVFRAAADPQPGRGPDLRGCCEGRECGEFAGIEVTDTSRGWDRLRLAEDDVTALRATALADSLGSG